MHQLKDFSSAWSLCLAVSLWLFLISFPLSCFYTSRACILIRHLPLFCVLCLSHTHARVHRGAPGVDWSSSDGHATPCLQLPEALQHPFPSFLHKQTRLAGAPWLQRQSAGVPGGKQSQTLQNRTGTSNTIGNSSLQSDSYVFKRRKMINPLEARCGRNGGVHECVM